MKKILAISSAPDRHWVGNGFPVHGMFDYNGDGVAQRSPFLLLDYAAPTHFESTTQRRGVGQHPHRGFETVTFVYAGEVEHRDSAGNGGVIRAGDVQWMTAGSGILHEEFHSAAYAQQGGPFEMVQLWVNLPAKDKMTAPAYQGITGASIPTVQLPGDAGTLRVIAGDYNGHVGPARTFTPIQAWDVRLAAGKSVELALTEGWTALLVVLAGTVLLNGGAPGKGSVLRETELATLATEGTVLRLEANSDVKILLLAGEPINEPVVGHGPFVMNTRQEITQAINDFNTGTFGRID